MVSWCHGVVRLIRCLVAQVSVWRLDVQWKHHFFAHASLSDLSLLSSVCKAECFGAYKTR